MKKEQRLLWEKIKYQIECISTETINGGKPGEYGNF